MPSKDDFQLNSLIKSSLEPRVSIKFALMKHLFKNEDYTIEVQILYQQSLHGFIPFPSFGFVCILISFP